MRVETVITPDGRERYMLVDSNYEPISPVLKFLKFKDNNDAARNSLRAYCQHLKLYFEFLEQEGLDYRNVSIDDMAAFLRWLQNPYSNLKVTSVRPVDSPRKPNTINAIISTVLSFYDFLMRHEDYNIQIPERLKKTIPGSRRGFKDFLYHITKDKQYSAKILKVKVPKTRPKVLRKEQVEKLIDCCNNIRDKFLIHLLWETGMRIGEALALWLEDFEIDAQKIHIVDRGELENKAEIKTVNSPRIIDVSPDLINYFMEYVAECHTDEVDTNHVFIKLDGPNKYQPLDHVAVNSLFKRLKNKTGIDFVSPHKLRHTHFTILNKAGWTPEKMMKRGGWANVQTVINTYVHISDEKMHEQWQKTEQNKKFRLKRQQKEEL
jgi:integrase